MLNNFFISNPLADKGSNLYRQIMAVNYLLLVAIMAEIFIFLDYLFIKKNYLSSAVIALFLFLTLFSFYTFKHYKNIKLSSITAIISLYSVLIAIVLIFQLKNYTLLWTLGFPMIIFMISGHKRGLYFSIIFFVIIYAILYSYIDRFLSGTEFIRYVLFSIIITLAFYLQEKNTYEAIDALQRLNDELDLKIIEGIKKSRAKDELLQQQSKLAAMGEMIGAIAHQWRQPLNILNLNMQMLHFDYLNNKIDETYLLEYIDKNEDTISFMSQTIDDFRNFFRIEKEVRTFDVKAVLLSTLNMLSAQLQENHIHITITGDSFSINSYQTELQQVIINLVANAKDALIEKKIKEPRIEFIVENDCLEVIDNAGGIEEEVAQRIFEPYFTTKPQGKGTGMGLYMSKMIIEQNMQGHIEYKSVPDGSNFIICFNDAQKQ